MIEVTINAYVRSEGVTFDFERHIQMEERGNRFETCGVVARELDIELVKLTQDLVSELTETCVVNVVKGV